MTSLVAKLFRRLVTLALMIGPFAMPAEAQTPGDKLWDAINGQDVAALRAAVAEGADVNAANNEGRMPLYRALVLQRQPLVEALLELGANANATDHHGDPLLIIALSVGSADGALALIRAGADPSARDTIGKSALYYAINMRQPEIVAALIAAGGDVNAPSDAIDASDPTLPLFLAIKLGDLAVAQQLLAAGADANARDAKGSTPLHRAVLARPEDFLLALLGALFDAGADANAMRPKGGAPLHNFLFGGGDLQPATIEAVLALFARHQGDLNLPAEFDGATPLDVARGKGNQAAVDLLSGMGAVCKNAC
jgi:ankyrin repeat protein